MGELVTGDGVREASGDLSLHLGCPSPASQGLACPVTHLLSPRPLLCERPLGIDYYPQCSLA